MKNADAKVETLRMDRILTQYHFVPLGGDICRYSLSLSKLNNRNRKQAQMNGVANLTYLPLDLATFHNLEGTNLAIFYLLFLNKP